MNDEIKSTCPTCGSTYPKAGLGGFAGMCPHCMMADALPSEDELVPNSNEQAGTRITRYTLIEQIGSGGMGSVWRAKQEEPIQREVALKIIKLGMDTHEVVSRFEAERQALAAMDHPNIAKVLDAGATDEGRPFFVMELIDGEPITEFCQHHNLDLPARLKLFSSLCRAIEHAHQKGIIHRDLKPSNVMIDTASEEPAVKVIDFGVAKAIEQGERARTMFTQVGHMVGTPAYMSPEQAQSGGADIDTRSDIYSLGVLLYELLTGSPPFEPQRLAKVGIEEVCRVIREEEPPKPSTRVADPESVSITGFQISPEKLSGVIRGDLDWIVMKALEKDRSRRYDTANGLAADIRRHLNHQPVEAGAPGNWYRLQKYARRNKVLFSSLLTVGLILLLASTISIWQAVRATHAEAEQRTLREEADASRHLADDKTEEMRNQLYLSDMWRASEASGKPGLQKNVDMLTEPWIPNEGETDRREWEWYYLRSARNKELFSFTLPSPPSEIETTRCAWLPDGRQLLAVGGQVAAIWDVETRRRLKTIPLGQDADLMELALSPDGQHAAFAWKSELVTVHNTENGSLVRSFETTKMSDIDWADSEHLVIADYTGAHLFAIHTDEKKHFLINETWIPGPCDLSPDGSRLMISGYRGRQRQLWEFNVKSGSKLREQTIDLPNTDLRWSPDGKHIAVGNFGQFTSILDVKTLKPIKRSFSSSILAWAPDGSRIAFGRGSPIVQTISVLEQEEQRILDTGDKTVTGLAWSPDGQWIATSKARGSQIQVWPLKRERMPVPLSHGTSGIHHTVTWSPSRQQAISSQSQISQNRRTPGQAAPIELWNHPTAWSPDGTFLAVYGNQILKLWNETTEQLVSETRIGDIVKLQWSPDGRRLALVRGGISRGAIMADIPSLDILWRTTLAGEEVNSGGEAAAWLGEGEIIAVPSEGHDIALLDADTSDLKEKLKGHSDWINDLRLSPDTTRLASASTDQTCRIWNVETRETIHVLDHNEGVRSIAWSPDNRRLATGSMTGVVRIWDPENGREVLKSADSGGMINSMDWSEDGGILVVGYANGSRAGAYDARRALRSESIRKAQELGHRGDWISAKHQFHKALTTYLQTNDNPWVATDWQELGADQEAASFFASGQPSAPIEQDSDGVVLLPGEQSRRLTKRFYLASAHTLNLHLECPENSRVFLEKEEIQVPSGTNNPVRFQKGWNTLVVDVTPNGEHSELSVHLSKPTLHSAQGFFPSFPPSHRRRLLQRRIEEEPNEAKHWRDLAELEQSLERFPQAGDALTQALALDSEHKRGKTLLRQLLSQWGQSPDHFDDDRSLTRRRAAPFLDLLHHADQQPWNAPKPFWIRLNQNSISSHREATSSEAWLAQWQEDSPEACFEELANFLPDDVTASLRHRYRLTMARDLPIAEDQLSLVDWQDRFRMQVLLRNPTQAIRALDGLLNLLRSKNDAKSVYQGQEALRLKILLLDLQNEDTGSTINEYLQIPPRDPSLTRQYIDLSELYNAPLHDQRGWLDDAAPSGTDFRLYQQTSAVMQGVSFDARGIIQLRGGKQTDSKVPARFPERIMIPVDQKASQLHLLLSCVDAGAQPGEELATVVIHYEDGESVSKEILYGTHVLDWLLEGSAKQLGEWQPSWKEEATSGRKIHLNRWRWINSAEEKVIKEIELISSLGKAALFVTAVTLEPPLKEIDELLAEIGKSSTPAETRRTKELLKTKERYLRWSKKQIEADEVFREIQATPARDPARSKRQLDLTPLYNASLYDSRGCEPFYPEFNLSMLPERFTPRHGADFDLRGIVQLNSGVYDRPQSKYHGKDLKQLSGRHFPDRVEIPVKQTADQVHFLLGSIMNELWLERLIVARLHFHYRNGTCVERPLFVTYDFVNWIVNTDYHLANNYGWTGQSQGEKPFQLTEFIFRNPHPDQVIDRIEFISNKIMAAPFLVGVTLRDHKASDSSPPELFSFPPDQSHLFSPLAPKNKTPNPTTSESPFFSERYPPVENLFDTLGTHIHYGTDVTTRLYDWDLDGDLDLLIGLRKGRVLLMRNQGMDGNTPRFSLPETIRNGWPENWWKHPDTGVCYAQLIGSPQPDLIVAHSGKFISIHENIGEPGAPEFSQKSLNITTQDGCRGRIDLADWNGDGLQDLITGSESGKICWHPNQGTSDKPSFSDPVPLQGLPKNAAPRIIDFDQDGQLDLVFGIKEGTISWIRNVGTKTAPDLGPEATPIDFRGPSNRKIDLRDLTGGNTIPDFADLDGDGIQDLVTGGANGKVWLLRGRQEPQK